MFSELVNFCSKGKSQIWSYSYLFLFLILSFSLTSIFGTAYGWHDQQRIAQLVLLIVSTLLSFMLGGRGLSAYALLGIILIFGLGLLSSFDSEFPEWALKEWARYFALINLVVLVGRLASGCNFRMAIFFCMALVATAQVFQFLVLYVSAFVSGLRLLDASVLLSGFSNPRFYGQFQALLIPILTSLIFYFVSRNQKKMAVLFVVVLTMQWCISFMLGGRGFWLAALLSHAALFLFAGRFWRLVVMQLLVALVGFCLFLSLFVFVPYIFDIKPYLYDGLRADLSSREVIWCLAWKMAIAHPWFGVGPMHFSATYNAIAAHPHQVALQWLAEWGAPATVVAVLLICWGMLSGVRFLGSAKAKYEDAGLWVAILSSLLLAQVDGVFVMPYTETWLAVLAGIALSRWSRSSSGCLAHRAIFALCGAPVIFILGLILFSEVAVLSGVEQAYLENKSIGLAPRFWEQGWIPMEDFTR